MARAVVVMPHATISPAEVEWGTWQLLSPHGVDLHDVHLLWDHDVDLKLSSEVKIPRSVLEEALGVEVAQQCHAVVEIVCNASSWRAWTCASLHDRPAALEDDLVATISVEIPGGCVAESISLRLAVTGPAITPGGNVVQPQRGARIAQGPVTTVALEPASGQLPVTATSFSEVGWRSIPWRFDVSLGGMADPYAACVRLWVNTDFPVSKELTDPERLGASRRTLSSLRFDVLRALFLQLHRYRKVHEARQEFQAIDIMDPDSLGRTADRLASSHLQLSLNAALDLIDTDPHEWEQRLAETTGYYEEAGL